MAKIEVYSTQTCPYCVKAKNLLSGKGLEYTEIDITGDNDARMALVEKANGMRTVPQIFVNDQHVGGYDNLNEISQNGDLDKMVNA